MMRTSVTGPNMAKYSLSFSELVCQLRPPTKSFDGDGEVVPVFVGAGAGVERPLDGEASGTHRMYSYICSILMLVLFDLTPSLKLILIVKQYTPS